MIKLPFWKWQSVGNDFVLVHLDDLVSVGRQHDLSEIAQVVCARRWGVGSDGLLVLSRNGADLLLRMFNPDGTEDFCGNGTRCAAAHARELGWIRDAFCVVHRGIRVEGTVFPDGSVQTRGEPISFDPQVVPHMGPTEIFEKQVGPVVGSAVSTGSTHFVIFRPSVPDDEEFFGVSPLIENDPLFPSRTSVIWASEMAENRLQIRIWERGVGETLGCGTGSVAAALVHMRRTCGQGEIEVQNPGGIVGVEAPKWSAPSWARSRPMPVFRGSQELSI